MGAVTLSIKQCATYVFVPLSLPGSANKALLFKVISSLFNNVCF